MQAGKYNIIVYGLRYIMHNSKLCSIVNMLTKPSIDAVSIRWINIFSRLMPMTHYNRNSTVTAIL